MLGSQSQSAILSSLPVFTKSLVNRRGLPAVDARLTKKAFSNASTSSWPKNTKANGKWMTMPTAINGRRNACLKNVVCLARLTRSSPPASPMPATPPAACRLEIRNGRCSDALLNTLEVVVCRVDLDASKLGELLLKDRLVHQQCDITTIVHQLIAAISPRHCHHLLCAPPSLWQGLRLCGCRCCVILGAEKVHEHQRTLASELPRSQ